MMTPDALSQEEIDALLKGAGGGGGGESSAPEPTGKSLDADQKESLTKYGELMATTQSDMIGTFLGETVKVTSQGPTAEDLDSLVTKLGGDLVVCVLDYDGVVCPGRAAFIYTANRLPEKLVEPWWGNRRLPKSRRWP